MNLYRLAFLGGFITGGFTVFIVTALTVWKPIIETWRNEWFKERARRIVAEDNAAHAFLGAPTRASWPSPLPPIDRPRVETHPLDVNVVDLTGVDDPFLDEGISP